MWLNSWAETMIDPAKHHYRPSSVHQFPTKTANSCNWSLQSYELWKDPDHRHILRIYAIQSWMGCSTYHVPCLSHSEHERVHQSCHKQSTKGFTSQWSFQQIKKVILHAIWRSRYIYHGNSNAAAAAIGSWLSSKNSPHQTIRAHMEKELLRMISHNNRRLVANWR